MRQNEHVNELRHSTVFLLLLLLLLSSFFFIIIFFFFFHFLCFYPSLEVERNLDINLGEGGRRGGRGSGHTRPLLHQTAMNCQTKVVYTCTSISTYIRLSVHIHIHVCIFINIYIYVCVFGPST